MAEQPSPSGIRWQSGSWKLKHNRCHRETVRYHRPRRGERGIPEQLPPSPLATTGCDCGPRPSGQPRAPEKCNMPKGKRGLRMRTPGVKDGPPPRRTTARRKEQSIRWLGYRHPAARTDQNYPSFWQFIASQSIGNEKCVIYILMGFLAAT